jgi:hypothetical protein
MCCLKHARMGETHGNTWRQVEAHGNSKFWCEYHVFLYASSRSRRDIFLRVSLDNHLYLLPDRTKFGMTPVGSG